jgi:hypothetical protein
VRWRIIDNVKYSYCCSDLEKLVHPGGAGLGLTILVNKRGPRFFLEYRNDWHVPVSEVCIEIKFCPYCGSRLAAPSSMSDQSSK